MKPIIQSSKLLTLCIAMLFAAEAKAQFFPIHFATGENNCIDLGIDTLGVTFTPQGSPFSGTLIPGIRSGSWVYCPDSGFIGMDRVFVNYCINGPTFPICDSTFITFLVQATGCGSFTIAIQEGSCTQPSLAVVAIGGAPPYQYFWDTGSTGNEACSLANGSYCVTVTDSNGCALDLCRTVPVYCESFSIQLNPPDTSGCVHVLTSGGTPPFSYAWSTGNTTGIECNPLSNTCVTVTDARGCTDVGCTFNCGTFLVLVNSGQCAGPLPSLQATAFGGTPPYQYLWSTGDTGSVVCNLVPGFYCVTVTDVNGCTRVVCENTGGCPLTTSLSYNASTQCLTGSVTGGAPPYTFLWSTGDSIVSTANSNTVCGVPPGNHSLSIMDSQGCGGWRSITVGCQLSVALAYDSLNGCLNSTVTGGSPPYTYTWSPGGITTSTICSVFPGVNYCLTVTDVTGCAATACSSGGGCNLTSVITQSGSCLVVTTTGGSGPFSYNWSNGSTVGPTMCPGNPGTYCVTITDAQLCSDVVCGTVGGCQLSVTIVEDSARCLNVVVTGGTPPFTYAWSDGAIANPSCSIVPGATYSVTVTDAQGCTGTAIFTSNCTVTVALSYDSLNACITANAAGGSGSYAYTWSDLQTTQTICNVTPGTSPCVTVTDANGCSASACSGQNGSCSFAYTMVSTPLGGSVVTLTALFQNLNPDVVLWDFNDGMMGTGSSITHTYSVCDLSYNVSMTLVDSIGNTLCAYSESIYVPCADTNSFCQASFVAYANPANSLAFNFVDQSVYNPVAYQWDFGDGNTSTLQNPTHTFAAAGIYNVCLVITDATGCSSTACQQVNAGGAQVQDLSVYLYHQSTVTPGFTLYSNISYCNYGSTMMNGTVEYRYPAGTTYSSASPLPASHDVGQRLLTFNFTNLYPNTCGYITVNLSASTGLFIGTPVSDTAWVKPIAGDINPADNVSHIKTFVVGSWDPNDKAVSPKGDGDEGDIPVNTEVLTYKVRFQNTGTAPAVNVVIRDTMDGNIDLTSVAVPDASHDHITQVIGNVLVVSFHNIMLPDSNSNEPASHGYIQVFTRLKPGLAEGAKIYNTAAIYFDFNELVITNTVVNTLKNTTGIRERSAFEFSIVPNPAQDKITIRGSFSRNAGYEVLNELGQVVLGDVVTSDKMQIEIGSLHPGIYFVRVKSKDKVGTQRLFVVE